MDPISHLSLPLRIAASSYVVVEQDTLGEYLTTVATIVAFPIGFRIEAPEFGVAQHEFDARPLSLRDTSQAIEAYEPRAAVTVTEQPFDPLNPERARVQISVGVVDGEGE
jgi:hypothetical protein